ncbi:MAG: hypothetical protein QME81_06435 [bacterium]|nr:hypothetical protein [bacterium]
MKQIIVGFNGTPSEHCGIPVPIVQDKDGMFKKMIGKKRESPINQAAFDAYVHEGRITRLPDTEAEEGDAILYVKRPFIDGFILDGEAAWQEIDVNTALYYDKIGTICFSWVESEELWFVVKKKNVLVKQMDHWAKLLCNRFDDKWTPQPKDMDRLLETAELIVSCAYKENLLGKGYARLALTYKYFNPKRIKALHAIFIQSDLGITMKETQDMIRNIEEELKTRSPVPWKNKWWRKAIKDDNVIPDQDSELVLTPGVAWKKAA